MARYFPSGNKRNKHEFSKFVQKMQKKERHNSKKYYGINKKFIEFDKF